MPLIHESALVAFVGAINAPRRVQQRVVVTRTSQQRCSRFFAVRPFRRLTVPRSFSSSASCGAGVFVRGLCRVSLQRFGAGAQSSHA
eukprot:5133419-Prymnesium_polylepis.1